MQNTWFACERQNPVESGVGNAVYTCFKVFTKKGVVQLKPTLGFGKENGVRDLRRLAQLMQSPVTKAGWF